ncbi:MAG: molybdenum ABC transporter ATP-binding protein [Pseudomonadota bacterium]
MSASKLDFTLEAKFSDFALNAAASVPLSGVTAVFGPSGSGKTSLLYVIAGFIRPDTGRITFGEETWLNTAPRAWTPTHKRGVGVVFQDAQLFPHLSVRGNLDYARKRADQSAPGHPEPDIIAAMDLTALLDRDPQTLSGGERQRVAIARTLLTRPRLLLLDEPLAALDTARKGDLLPFLETLKTQFAVPTLYVSHDVDEVSRIADRVLMMEAGRIVASGRTDEVLSRFGLEAGRNPYEAASILHGEVDIASESGLVAVRIGDAVLWLAADLHLDPGTEISIKVPARDVAIALERPDKISIQNMIPAKVSALREAPRAAFQSVTLDVGGQTLDSIITRKSVQALGLKTGCNVFALIKSATFHA